MFPSVTGSETFQKLQDTLEPSWFPPAGMLQAYQLGSTTWAAVTCSFAPPSPKREGGSGEGRVERGSRLVRRGLVEGEVARASYCQDSNALSPELPKSPGLLLSHSEQSGEV